MLTIARGTTYSFRRKVPEPARRALGRGELWITLRTGDRRKAESVASLLRWLTDDLFERAGMADEDKDEIETLRREVAELQHVARFDGERRRAEELLRRKAGVAAELAQVNGQNVELAKEVARLQADRDARTTSRLAGAVAHLAASVSMTPAPAASPEPKPSPAVGEHLAVFMEVKQYQPSIRKQTEVTVRLLSEIVGDKSVREYTREDAGVLYEAILKLPSSHGKGGYVHALEAIKANEVAGKPTVSMKTLKRHFSALKQYWEYLKARGHVDEVIFAGFSYPGAKGGKSKRDDWSPNDLERLFTSEQWRAYGKDSAYRWLPIIALYTGMRLEEICRIRPRDVRQEQGIWSIFIVEHTDFNLWSPKTEAGERVVPIHSMLIRLGFLDLVQQRQTHPYIFSDLVPGGPDGKRGYRFSRDFSKLKISLGISRKTVFHSFRHSVRTLVEDSPMLKDNWIDAVLGHDNGEASEGVKTYLKRIGIHRLQEVIEAIKPTINVLEVMEQAAARR